MDFKCIITLQKYNNFNPFGNRKPLMFQISILFIALFIFLSVYGFTKIILLVYYQYGSRLTQINNVLN